LPSSIFEKFIEICCPVAFKRGMGLEDHAFDFLNQRRHAFDGAELFDKLLG